MNLRGINGKLIAVQEAGTNNAVQVYARTTPTAAGAWETIKEEVHPEYDRDIVALVCEGRYASAQPDGRLEWNRTVVGPWELFQAIHDGAEVGYRSLTFGTFMCCDLGLPVASPDGWTGHQIVCNRHVFGPYEHFAVISAARYPLMGRVYLKDGTWHDNTGPVPLFFHHDMPHVCLDEIDPAEADRAADAIARVGSGARIFWRLAKDVGTVDRPGSYWYGRGIDDACYRAHLEPSLRRFNSRGLKVALTMGALLGNEKAYYDHWMEVAEIITGAKLEETIAIAEFYNENDMNNPFRDNPVSAWLLAQKIMTEFKKKVGCIVTGGSWGDNENVGPSALGMDAFDVHGNRSMPEAIHHIHTTWNDQVFHKNYARQVWRGEEPGNNSPYPENTNNPRPNLGGDVYVGCDDPEMEAMIMFQAQFTGQAQAWLNGPGVRHFVPLDSTAYGFRELPELLHTHIPRDAGLWRGSNPSWRTPGDPNDPRFMYSGLAEWGQVDHPPFPIKDWKAIGPFGITDVGTGPIKISDPKWKGRLIVGTRA